MVHFNVIFSAWLPHDAVFPYVTNKEKFMLKNRIPRGFREAVEAVDDALKAMPEEVGFVSAVSVRFYL